MEGRDGAPLKGRYKHVDIKVDVDIDTDFAVSTSRGLL